MPVFVSRTGPRPPLRVSPCRSSCALTARETAGVVFLAISRPRTAAGLSPTQRCGGKFEAAELAKTKHTPTHPPTRYIAPVISNFQRRNGSIKVAIMQLMDKSLNSSPSSPGQLVVASISQRPSSWTSTHAMQCHIERYSNPACHVYGAARVAAQAWTLGRLLIFPSIGTKPMPRLDVCTCLLCLRQCTSVLFIRA